MVNKKGFFKALMTVALALMSVSVFATAPVITDPGDYIIGDNEQGAGNNIFVFPDAIDLDGSVVDDNTADGSIKWSFDDPSSRYLLNGVAGGVVDPNAPANDLRQLDNDTADAANDASAATLTLRDGIFSPLGGPNTDPGGTGIVASSTITLFASDAALFDSVSIVLYTSDDGSDSLSGGILTNIFDHDYENDPSVRTGWVGQVTPNSTAGTTGTGTGFCMGVPGANIAGATVRWLSPHNQSDTTLPGFVQLVDLAAWRYRATMYSDVTANNATPYWTVGYNNAFFTGAGGSLQSSIYGGDTWVLDGTGGANAIGKMVSSVLVGRYDYDFWAVPPPAMCLAWRGQLPDIGAGPPSDNNLSPFAPTFDFRNDMNFTIRILDDNAGINTTARLGTICLRRLRCDRVSLNDLTTTLIYGPAINTATHAVLPDAIGSPGNGTGVVRNATADILFNLGPAVETNANGGRKRAMFYNPAGTSVIDREYPLDDIWVTDRVFLVKGAIRSDVGGVGGTVEGTDPVEIIFMDWQAPTNEVGGFHFAQKGSTGNMKRAASPRLLATTAGAPQEYISIMAANNETRTTASTFNGRHDAFRAIFDFQNSTATAGTTDGRNPFVLSTMQLLEIDTTGF
jgi:hypothetical protein